MPIDFSRISGPAASAPSNFEKMCLQIIQTEFPEAKGVEGKGGDEGVDAFIGTIGKFAKKVSVFQFKFFTETLTPSRKRQISNSLQTALRKHNPAKWVLCVPKTLTPAEHSWWADLVQSHTDIEISLWDEAVLRQLLLKHPNVKAEFFPEKFTEQQEEQLRGLLAELVSPLPEDMAFLLKLSEIAKRIQRDPNQLQADILEWCLSAQAPLDVGMRSLAISDCQRAKEQLQASIHADESRLAQKKLLLGNAHLCLSELREAIDNYNGSLQLDAHNVTTLVNLGATHRFNGDAPKAIASYTQALQIDSTVPQLHNNLGVAWDTMDDYAKAIECYTKALALDQHCFPALYNRAMAYGLSGRFEESVADFVQANEAIEYFRDLEAMGARNPLFPFKSLGSLLLEGIFPIIHEAQAKLEGRGGILAFSLGGGSRKAGREPTLTYDLPQGLTSHVLSQSVLMFYNFSPRDIGSLRTFINEYCKNRHRHFRSKSVYGTND